MVLVSSRSDFSLFNQHHCLATIMKKMEKPVVTKLLILFYSLLLLTSLLANGHALAIVL